MRIEYTKSLLEKGQARKRLTKQLAALVAQVAQEIADSVPLGTRIEVNGRAYETRCLRSNIGTWNVLGTYENVRPDDHMKEYRVFTDDEPGIRYNLHNDIYCRVATASKEAYLEFVNNLPEIVRAFEAREDEIIQALSEGLRKLRQIAEQEKEE